MEYFFFLNRFLHLMAAIVWVGGMAHIALVIRPIITKPQWQDLRVIVAERVGSRFRTVAWIAIPILVVTGLIQLGHAGAFAAETSAEFWGRPSLLIKVILTVICLMLSAVHDFWLGPEAARHGQRNRYSQDHHTFRDAAVWVARVNMILVLMIVYLGLLLAG